MAATLLVVLVVCVVTVDTVFLRHHVLTRLVVNVAIVAVFVAVYSLISKRA